MLGSGIEAFRVGGTRDWGAAASGLESMLRHERPALTGSYIKNKPCDVNLEFTITVTGDTGARVQVYSREQ